MLAEAPWPFFFRLTDFIGLAILSKSCELYGGGFWWC
jgi:hypothetical protein